MHEEKQIFYLNSIVILDHEQGTNETDSHLLKTATNTIRATLIILKIIKIAFCFTLFYNLILSLILL